MTNKYDNGQTFFECAICDFDSALFRAAQYVEEKYIVVKCKRSGVELEFPNKTTFWGRQKNTITGEIGKWADFLGIAIERDDFEIVEKVRFKSDFEDDPLSEAFKEFNRAVGKVKNAHLAESYKLLIGGSGNFRYDVAKIQPYKGGRKEKPLIFSELREKVIAQYGDKIEIHDGVEADDVVGWYSTENMKHFNETGKYKYILCFIDKDLKQLVSANANLDHLNNGITYTTPEEALDFFCFQLLKGDQTDAILGVPDIRPEIRSLFGLRNGSGCGDVAASTIIGSMEGGLQKPLICAYLYMDHYGKDKVYTLADGTEYRWRDFFRENARLLRMQRYPNEVYDVVDVLETMFKVDLDKLEVLKEVDEITKQTKIKVKTN
jgi:hypothetical protein